MSLGIKDLKNKLGDDAELLDFEVEGDYLIAKFKHFQPTDVFNRVHGKWKDLGGEYQGGLGANSHFRIKRETPHLDSPRVMDETTKRIVEAIDLMERALTKLREAGY